MKPLLFVSFLALAGVGWCQAPVQDFSKGFEMLAGLGMPQLDSQATWAKVMDPDMMDYNLRDYTRSMKGNGWVIRDKDGATRQWALGSLTEVETPKTGKESQPQDLDKDVETIIETLNKAVTKKAPDEIFSEYRYSSIDPLLLFATQLHQTGRKDLANRLAQATFAFFPTRDSAIDAVVNRLAEHFHQKAVSAFFESGDWSTYHRDLSALADRYPRGWGNRGAVRMMLPQLDRQAKGETAPDPAVPGVTIDPKAMAILRELMQPPKRDAKAGDSTEKMPAEVRRQMLMMQSMGHGYQYDRGGFHQNLWLIATEFEVSDDPQSRLAKLGMAALPALAAAAVDPYFTYQRNSSSDSHYYSSGESEDERTLRAYQSMNRPATRGEIATSMLALTLPDPENELRQADAVAIRDMAMDFWKNHRDATPEQLAAVFLKEGSEQQSSSAVEVLAASKNPDTLKLFEDHVLAADPAIASFEAVRTYLKARKAEGKPFFDRYAELVRKQNASTGDEDASDPFGGSSSHSNWRIKEAGGVEKILKQLQAVAEGESPRAMAIRIGKEDGIKTAPAAINGLMEAMSGEEPKKQLIALLSGAYAAAKDENVRAQFLTAIFRIDWDTKEINPLEEKEEEEKKGEETKPAPREITEAEGKVWQRLIADSRPLKTTARGHVGGSQKMNVSMLACAALESSVVGHEYYSLMQAIPIMARPANEVLAERAKARLDGKPVPPLPNAENVTPERLAAIVSLASEKPAAELHAHLLTLTMDERAAWAAWLQEPGEIPMPDNVKLLRHQVVKYAESGTYTAETMADFDAIPIGFHVSISSFETIIQSLAAQNGKYSRAIVSIGPTGFGPGLEVSASVLPFPEPKGEDEEEEDPYSRTITADRFFRDTMTSFQSDDTSDAIVSASISGNRTQAQATWSVKDGKATRVNKAENGEDQEEAFKLALQSALEAESTRTLRMQIRVLTRADAEKLNTNNE